MKRIVLSLLLLQSFALSSTGQELSTSIIAKAIEHQLNTYPASTLKDIYKSFFQDAFGPGHLMNNSADAENRVRSYLESECEIAEKDKNLCPDYELTGSHGRFYRVNLSVINDGRVPMDVFISAFMKSAAQFSLPEVEDWQEEWKNIESVIEQKGYHFKNQQEDSQAIKTLLEQGKYASHHSSEYNEAYHPHYRLIEKTIFETEILPHLNSSKGNGTTYRDNVDKNIGTPTVKNQP